MELLKDLETTIATLPEVEIVSSAKNALVGSGEFDLLLTLDVKGRSVSLVIETKAWGYPRDVRDAAWQLASVRDLPWPHPLIPMVAAPAISESGRAILKSDGIGFWDSSGSMYLEVPWAFFWIDKPVPKLGRGKRVDIFQGHATQVLHAMLIEPSRQWHVQDLAIRSEVSKSTAHQVLVALEDQLWVSRQGKGPQTMRILVEPGALLDAWATRHSLAAYQRVGLYRWARSSKDLLQSVVPSLESMRAEYALTLDSGAHFVAPYVTESRRLTLLVPESSPVADLISAAGLKQVEEGENIVLLKAREATPLMFKQQIQQTWIASNIQLYLDLWVWPQRGKEQAEHLRRERIGF